MPRGKSTAASRRSGGRQNTLSFSTNKVTKPSGAQTTLGKTAETKASKLLSETSSRDQTPTEIDDEPTTAEIAIREQTKEESQVLTEEEEKALKVPETQINKYWKAKEDLRITPRLHQEQMSTHDKVLREFDMSSNFGPCIGIARTKRWKRAQKLGLNPPIEVLAVLMKESAKEDSRIQRAHIDELMSARTLALATE